MKAFLVLACLFGLAFYLLTSPPGPRDGAETVAAVDEAVGETSTHSPSSPPLSSPPLSSWGPSLHATRAEPQEVYVPAPVAPVAPAAPAAPAAPRAAAEPFATPLAAIFPEDEQAEDAAEWVKLTATVRARSAASVSSAGLRSYPKGLKARVLGREDGWVQVLDPRTEERGWVYHAYLAPADAAGTADGNPSVAAAPRRSESAGSQDAAFQEIQAAARQPDPVAEPAAIVKVKKAKRKRRGLFKRRRAQRAMTLGPAR